MNPRQARAAFLRSFATVNRRRSRLQSPVDEPPAVGAHVEIFSRFRQFFPPNSASATSSKFPIRGFFQCFRPKLFSTLNLLFFCHFSINSCSQNLSGVSDLHMRTSPHRVLRKSARCCFLNVSADSACFFPRLSSVQIDGVGLASCRLGFCTPNYTSEPKKGAKSTENAASYPYMTLVTACTLSVPRGHRSTALNVWSRHN